MRCKDLESLKRRISECESHLEQDAPGDNTPNSNDLLDQGAEVEMATAPGADDTPLGSAVALACKMLFLGTNGCVRSQLCKQLFCQFSCSFVSKACAGLGNGCETFAHRDLC